MLNRIVCTGLFLLAASSTSAEEFRFVVLGDAPYGSAKKVYAPFEVLIDVINQSRPDFVAHVGDTKSGSTPCSDQRLIEQLRFLNQFDAPTLYTPGDNEWTDCHRKKSEKRDPIERLALILQHYFAEPATSFGRNPVAVTHQGRAGYRENVRLLHKRLLVITAHVVGSNNNFQPRDLDTVRNLCSATKPTPSG